MRETHTLDATGQVVGRLATKIAVLLRGKQKPSWSPEKDAGDFVVVTNASKMRITGRKGTQKIYFRHTGYPGHVTQKQLGKRLESEPHKVLSGAVRNMLPVNRLRPRLMKRLTIHV